MDWFNQLRLKNTLILLLVMMNLITVSVLWVQTGVTDSGENKKRVKQSQESAEMMREELGLSKEQSEKISSLLLEYHAQTKPVNEQMTEMKKQLAERVFLDENDSALAIRLSEQIGMLQKDLELLRFRHFTNIAAVCDSAQKAKLRPVIIQLFGKKPPKNDSPIIQENMNDQRTRRPQGDDGSRKKNRAQEERNPPSSVEKLEKYSERLELSSEQRKKLEIILTASQKRGVRLRDSNGDRQTIEAEKERIRKDEDDRILDILTNDQKVEFRKMIEKRRR